MDDFFRHWGIPQEQKQTSLGSGFIFDKSKGYLLTNHHVVQHAKEVFVTLSNKKQYRAKIIGRDQKLDLALLQIQETNKKIPTDLTSVALGDSDSVRIAESVIAVGNPFGLQGTVTAGIISAKNRTIGVGPFDNFLQTDASINPGNSGGPLFNLKGEVIGINTVIYSNTGQSGGIGFAIPMNLAKSLIPDLIAHGHVLRPWLGILAQTMSPALQEYFDFATGQGVLVANLVDRGPADRGGLRRGDIITRIGGAEVLDIHAIERELSKLKPTDSVKVSIRRGFKKLELTLKLNELPALEDLPQGII
jgi:serine protease Do